MTDIAASITEGIHHLGITVPNIIATKDFFIQQLNFIQVGEKPDYPAVFISDGTIMLTLWQTQNSETCVSFNRHNNVGLHHFALKVTSKAALHALHEKLQKLESVTVEFAPEALGNTSIIHMMCSIPGGVRVEFIAT